MKAIIWTRYGSPDGLVYTDIAKPAPKDHQILVKTHATSVTAGDTEVRALKFPLLLGLAIRLYMGAIRPRDKVLGQELAGVVEAVGKDVTRFKVGDRICAHAGLSFGGYAEYACLSENAPIATLPETVSFAQAAALPTGGSEALHFIRLADLKPGDKIVVYAAGGSIGTFGVQLAKHFGAEVTAVDHGDKLAMLREIGADHVVDYTREDFAQSGAQYDAIFDVIGKAPLAGSIASLKAGGRYLLANPRMGRVLRGKMLASSGGKQFISQVADPNADDLKTLVDLMQSGAIKSVIDREFPLAQTADAHRYAETGKKQGHIVIRVAE